LYGNSSAMAPVASASTPSSSDWPPAPTLPVIHVWPPEKPFPTQCGHYEESTELRHSKATQSTQPLSSWTLPSTVVCSRQSLSSSYGAGRQRARPLEDTLSSELPARQRRPLGCGLGSSISTKAAHSSILASSLSLSYCDKENGGLASADEVWNALLTARLVADYSGTNAAAAGIRCKPFENLELLQVEPMLD